MVIVSLVNLKSTSEPHLLRTNCSNLKVPNKYKDYQFYNEFLTSNTGPDRNHRVRSEDEDLRPVLCVTCLRTVRTVSPVTVVHVEEESWFRSPHLTLLVLPKSHICFYRTVKVE